MAFTRLISGLECTFDDCDLALVEQSKWCVVYNVTTLIRKPSGLSATIGGKPILFHRLVMQPPRGMTVDHINGNPLDNRRENMRLATRSQNAMNRGPDADNRSGYKGVYRHKGARQPNGKPWIALIQANRKRRHLGCFATAEEAAAAYRQAAIELHGEFAKF